MLFPIVVRRDRGISLMQFQNRILKGDSNAAQRRPDPAHDHFLRVGAGDDESADEHFVAGQHLQTR